MTTGCNLFKKQSRSATSEMQLSALRQPRHLSDTLVPAARGPRLRGEGPSQSPAVTQHCGLSGGGLVTYREASKEKTY